MDTQTSLNVGGGLFAALLAWILRDHAGRFKRVERTYVTAHAVDELLKASEARFQTLLRDSENRVDKRHESNENNFREVRLQLETVNKMLFQLALQKPPQV